MRIKLLLLLIISAITAYGETIDGDNIYLGSKSIPFSEAYGIQNIPDGSKKHVSFSISSPTDLKITVSMVSANGQKPLMMLYYEDQMQMLCTNYDKNCSSDPSKTVTIRNVPKGNYQIYLEANNFYMLEIQGMEPELKNTATDLGDFSESFSVSEVGCTGSVFDAYHGDGIANGMIAYRFHINTSMDFCADNTGNSTVSSAYMYLVNEKQDIVLGSRGSIPNTSMHKTDLPAGTYYVLANSDEVGELHTHISCNSAKGIDGVYTDLNRIIERNYTNPKGDSWNDKITFYDEMGREQETVQKGYTPKKKDLASLNEYDDYGRLERVWMPTAASNDESYMKTAEFKALSAQFHGDTHAYDWSIYESSPRNVESKSFGAGENWQENDHCIKTRMLCNDPSVSSLSCMKYTAKGDMASLTVKCEGAYAKGLLQVKETTDEDGRRSFEFKDGFGNSVLKRQEANGDYADTYFIYDAWGNLQVVLPPAASNEMCVSNKTWSEKDAVVANYAYLTTYDDQYRKIGNKLPGCDWVYAIYDKDDIAVFVQDGEQRQRGEWTFTISDVWGRPCLEGTCKNTLTVGTLLGNVSATYTGSSSNYGYAINGISLVSPTYLKVTFYDNYDFLSNQALGMSTLSYDQSQGTDYNTMVKGNAVGKQTGGMVSIDGNMANALKVANYYDYRGRNIQSLSTNQCGGMDKTYYAYDFTDHCTKERLIHSISGKKALIADIGHQYDHAGRLTTNTIAINNGTPTVVSDFGYDELGRLAYESHGNNKLQLTYTYNIRNWTKSIKGDLFSEQLFYDESHNGSKALYGGNISAMDWTTGDNAGKTRGYTFAYDQLDQLLSATYSENGSKNNHYSTSYSYDLMGNIQTLTRQGMLDNKSFGMMDNLVYNYNGNQVTKVTDKVSGPYGKDIMHFTDGANAEIEYKYNKNGCMTQDLNKNIRGIEYNLLNLPTKVSFSDGSVIKYSYSANGDKLSADYNLSLMNAMNGTNDANGLAQASSGVKLHRDYCGNFIYEDGVLKMMLIDGGYVTFDNDNSNPKFHFYLKDHLGNNRIVANAQGLIEQVNHYYPFGTLMAESNGDVQSYKYNGKELDRMHGLDSYDYGARRMADGRFTILDPHAIDYTNISPYAYCGNNPINAIDPNGKDEWEINSDGYVVNYLKTASHDAFFIVEKNGDKGYVRTSKSFYLPFGTIEKTFETPNGNLNVFKVNGNKNSSKLFEFLANNTSVEWSHFEFYDIINQPNTISTSHFKGFDNSGGFIRDNMNMFGNIMASHIHNHPSNIAIPSGTSSNGSKGDIAFIRSIKKSEILPSQYYIYTSNPPRYTKYNEKKVYSNLWDSQSNTFEISLDEFIVTPTKK